jgi:predicted ATPase
MSAVPFLSELLAVCPRLKILVTTRTLLRANGEQALPVLPLSLPDPDGNASFDVLIDAPAVQLFTQRAQAVNPSFTLTAGNAPLVADICRRLDGVPLAIELAAARVNHLPLPTLRERLDQRLPLLTSGARDRPDRHRTMRGAIAWSHDLLSADEQSLFCRLSVFAGGCSLEAAEYVAEGGRRKADEGGVRAQSTVFSPGSLPGTSPAAFRLRPRRHRRTRRRQSPGTGISPNRDRSLPDVGDGA